MDGGRSAKDSSRCDVLFAPRALSFLIEVSISSLPLTTHFPSRTTLTSGDRVVLRAIAEAMFAQDGEVDQERLDAHVDDVDRFISSASKPLRFALRVALFAVRVAPMLLLFRLRTIERLGIEDRARVLSRLERTRLANLSLAFIGWRTVMTLVFYEQPSELRAIGYAGDERKVYKRHLALASAPALALGLAAATSLPATPTPAESGVRLRERESERPAAASSRSGELGRDRVA